MGEADLAGNDVVLGAHAVPVNRGTPALLAAAIRTARSMGCALPHAVLVGDTGLGAGSRELYAHLAANMDANFSDILVFHYLQPDVDWHNRVLLRIQELDKRPLLIADAGYMYAAKMSGQAMEYDLFTPDVGELAFLADEKAPHPFYTRGFILQKEECAPEFIQRAYEYENAARHLLVKGRQDYVADSSGILGSVDAPSCPAMEAMGGTGDTLTGIVAGLVHAGMGLEHAAFAAARVNRVAGELCRPTPATQINELIQHIPAAIRSVLPREGA